MQLINRILRIDEQIFVDKNVFRIKGSFVRKLGWKIGKKNLSQGQNINRRNAYVCIYVHNYFYCFFLFFHSPYIL